MKQKHISEEKLVDYVLGNLSRIEYFKVSTHIKHCPRCQLSIQSWQKSLNHKDQKKLNTPSKQQIYNTFFQKRQLKRRRLIITLMGISLFAFIFLFMTSSKPQDLTTPFVKENNANNSVYETLSINEQSLDDYIHLFLQTHLPSTYEQDDYFHTKYKNALPHKQAEVKRVSKTKHAIITDEQICIVNWPSMEVVCYKYLQQQNQKYFRVSPKQFNILQH